MAELKGPILFTGSIGGIRAYYNSTLKRFIVSTKGGSTREQIKNNPAFARQRENMNEFKECSMWSSQLRKALFILGHLLQGYYFSGFMALAKSIQKHDDVRIRGCRSIESSKDAMLLKGLNLNQLHPFEQVFTQQHIVTFSEDKKRVTIQLLDFKSFARINWPVRFVSYRIAMVIAQLPDFYWNEADRMFLPVVPQLERLSVVAYSDWLPRSTEPEDIVLSASFAQPALQQPGTTVVVALGIEIVSAFGDVNPMNPIGCGTMKIVECFV
jgi:hypothetical protein